MAEAEDNIHDTEAVISFSLKCLMKVGRGLWPGTHGGPAVATPGKAPVAPHASRAGKAFHAASLDCKNPHVLPSLTQSAPRSRCSPPCSPRPPPTTESKTFQPTEPGAGVLSRCLPRTPGPVASRAARATLLPATHEVGEASVTHSTKCWHLHPEPGGRLTDL